MASGRARREFQVQLSEFKVQAIRIRVGQCKNAPEIVKERLMPRRVQEAKTCLPDEMKPAVDIEQLAGHEVALRRRQEENRTN